MAYVEIEKESFLHKNGEERVFFVDKDARERITALEQGGGGGSGTVTSVNNVQPDANGNVSLSANDVGAGTYSKPAGGIPASDLAAGVIPTVPQMATGPEMADWTSGKTVDAAVLKADFSSAIQRLGGLKTTVDDLQTAVGQKADSADIPTKTSDLTNDSGYQTATQVQTAIANAAELPSGGSAGDFLRKTASGVAWAAVPSAESNSFGGGS